jgi:hypothetical protein
MLFGVFLIVLPCMITSTFISSNILVPTNAPALHWMVIGDWGSKPLNFSRSSKLQREPRKQELVAKSMLDLASQSYDHTRFVISVGGIHHLILHSDNFYGNIRDGVKSINDEKWTSLWSSVYLKGALRNIPWFSVLGNHGKKVSNT